MPPYHGQFNVDNVLKPASIAQNFQKNVNTISEKL